MTKHSLKVLFLAAEADPFVKIGGLGDVAGSLPHFLRSLHPSVNLPPMEGNGAGEELEVDVRLVLPLHGTIRRQAYPFQRIASVKVPLPEGPVLAEVVGLEVNGLPIYFISGDLIPADAPVYTSEPSVDGIKFTFFSLAALELARTLDWIPHIVHANDWHTAMALYALALRRTPASIYYNTATILGVHNLPYLGTGAEKVLESFGLPAAKKSGLPKWAVQMPLPLGLVSADAIVAPSPSYAREILTPEFGSGLEEFLQTRREAIHGILNGLDLSRWNPRTDPALSANFDRDSLEERIQNKAPLQRELGLKEERDVPLLAVISRMDNQKGIDLIPDALLKQEDRRWQAVLLGTGDPKIEAAARQLETAYPDRIRAVIRFDSDLSRRIYAGADALLIPSRYEPCGLTQMIAMRYGCVPVGRAVGGLRDTIHDLAQAAEPTGFLFEEASSKALAGAIRRALQAYRDPALWRKLQENGMEQDFSWDRAAQEYLSLYLSLVAERIKNAHFEGQGGLL